MFFRKNTSMNKLSAFTLAALLVLGPAGCGGEGGGPTTGAPPATMPSRPQAPQIERTSIVVEPHPVFPVGASLPREDVYLPTRPGVRQRVLLARTANAGTKAVILFTGGNGTPITLPRHGGIRLTANSLVRSSELFAEAGFITAVVELPLDTPVDRVHTDAAERPAALRVRLPRGELQHAGNPGRGSRGRSGGCRRGRGSITAAAPAAGRYPCRARHGSATAGTRGSVRSIVGRLREK